MSNSVFLVKIGDQGLLTIEVPQMVGKYMVVEQTEDKLIITPFDLAGTPKTGAIARKGRQWTLLGTEGQGMPEA